MTRDPRSDPQPGALKFDRVPRRHSRDYHFLQPGNRLLRFLDPLPRPTPASRDRHFQLGRGCAQLVRRVAGTRLGGRERCRRNQDTHLARLQAGHRGLADGAFDAGRTWCGGRSINREGDDGRVRTSASPSGRRVEPINNPQCCEVDSRICKKVQEVTRQRSEKAKIAGGDGVVKEHYGVAPRRVLSEVVS